MFTPDQFIDSFQNAKLNFVNTFITDPTLKKAATDYVTAQTQFGKMLVSNTLSMTQYCVNSATKSWYNTTK